MDSTVLATRQAQAVNRIVETATTLANHLHLDPALIDALQPTVKDPDVKQLRRFEAIAELMFVLAISAGAVKEPAAPAEADLEPLPLPVVTEGDVTAVTDETPTEPTLTEPQEISEPELNAEVAATPEASGAEAAPAEESDMAESTESTATAAAPTEESGDSPTKKSSKRGSSKG